MNNRFSSRNILVLVAAVLAVFGPSSIHAQSIDMEIRSLDVSQFPFVQMRVNFTQQRSVFKRIEAQDITVSENNIPQAFSLDCPNSPVAVALVLDRSLSMAFYPNTEDVDPDSARWRSCKSALNTFVDQMQLLDSSALISFATSVVLEQGFTSDKKSLKDAAAGIALDMGTAAWKAALYAVNLLAQHKQDRAVIFLTDGVDNRSGSTTVYTVMNAAIKANVRFFTIGLGEDAGRADLDTLARRTGGKFYFSATGDDLSDIYFEISQRLAATCNVSYTSTNPCSDSTRRDVHLAASTGLATGSTDTTYIAPSHFESALMKLPASAFVANNGNLVLPVTLQLSAFSKPFTFDGTLQYPSNILKFSRAVPCYTIQQGTPIHITESTDQIRVQFTLDSLDTNEHKIFQLEFESVPRKSASVSSIEWLSSNASGFCPLLLSINGTTISADAACDQIVQRRTTAHLKQNYPNPFTASTTLTFSVPNTGGASSRYVELRIEDSYGRLVAKPVEGYFDSGDHTYVWYVPDIPSGSYHAVLCMDGTSESINMLIVK